MHASMSRNGEAGRRSATLALLVVGLDQATKLESSCSPAGTATACWSRSATPTSRSAWPAPQPRSSCWSWRPASRSSSPTASSSSVAGLHLAWISGLVVGGALSNLNDRLLLGSVRDFLAIGHLAVNLADLAVLAGLLGFSLAYPSHRPTTPVLGEEV